MWKLATIFVCVFVSSLFAQSMTVEEALEKAKKAKATQPSSSVAATQPTVTKMDAMWKRYGSNIVTYDGKFYNLGKTKMILAKLPYSLRIETNPPDTIGSVKAIPFRSKVLRILEDDGVIAVRPEFRARSSGGQWGDIQASISSESEIVFHIAGLPDKNLIDGSPLDDCLLIYNGTKKYNQKTIQSYVLPRPVTKDEFAKALADGFVLYDYSLVPTSKPKMPNHPMTMEKWIEEGLFPYKVGETDDRGKPIPGSGWFKIVETKVSQ